MGAQEGLSDCSRRSWALIEATDEQNAAIANAEDASFRCTNSEFGREAQVSSLNDSVVPPVVPRRELRDPKLPAPVDHRRLGACAAQAATRGEQGWINGNVQALPDGFGLNRLRL